MVEIIDIFNEKKINKKFLPASTLLCFQGEGVFKKKYMLLFANLQNFMISFILIICTFTTSIKNCCLEHGRKLKPRFKINWISF